jgi:hypothetical protein
MVSKRLNPSDDYQEVWVLRCDSCGRETFNPELCGEECERALLENESIVVYCTGILRSSSKKVM